VAAAALELCSAGWHCHTVDIDSSKKTNEPFVRKGCPGHKFTFW